MKTSHRRIHEKQAYRPLRNFGGDIQATVPPARQAMPQPGSANTFECPDTGRG